MGAMDDLTRMLFDLHEERTTSDPWLTRAERDAVLMFAAINWRIENPEET